MLQVDLTPELEQHLSSIAARTGEAPGEIARKALLAYLEDLEDYAAAVEADRALDRSDTVSLQALLTRYDVAD